MDTESARTYLLNKPEAIESFPFDAVTPVYKLHDKIFAIMGNHDGPGINLKCDPDQSLALRDIFKGITPGYHMNKKHWNTVQFNTDVPDGEIERLIDHSYGLILNNLPKTKQKYMATHYPPAQLFGHANTDQ